ncbi:MAG: TetR/AcrR family transcriptional regulator [Planctomycetota bacterium]
MGHQVKSPTRAGVTHHAANAAADSPQSDPPLPAPLPPWADCDHDQRRSHIVETALSLLHQHGLDAVTIRRVAAELGLGAMTLYTYLDGQDALRQAMVRRGFELLHDDDEHDDEPAEDLTGADHWRACSQHYIDFALERPNLFRLMFDTPLPPQDDDLLSAAFEPFLEVVRNRIAPHSKLTGPALDAEARRQAGRYWIAIHGLATLASANRLDVLQQDTMALLDDLLQRVAPH